MGTTYPRRAKQLVRNGRAKWLEEGQTLQLMPEPDSTPPAIIEEETHMDDKIYPANSKTEPYISDHTEESDGLLMYLAKKNVQDKKILKRHALAFIVAVLILGMLYGVNHSSHHPMHWRISDSMNGLHSAMQHIPEDYTWLVLNAVRTMESILFNHTPPIWYMLAGALLLWGAWIVVRAAKIFRRKKKSAKPDPVLLEYKRLKDTIDLR